MPCPRVPTQIVAFCVMVSLLLLRRLPRNPQGLSHRFANRHKGALLRGGGAEHRVGGEGGRQLVRGSAHPLDPPAPGWPRGRGFLPAATIDRGGAASPMLATRWKPPMLPLWGTPCT